MTSLEEMLALKRLASGFNSVPGHHLYVIRQGRHAAGNLKKRLKIATAALPIRSARSFSPVRHRTEKPPGPGGRAGTVHECGLRKEFTDNVHITDDEKEAAHSFSAPSRNSRGLTKPPR